MFQAISKKTFSLDGCDLSHSYVAKFTQESIRTNTINAKTLVALLGNLKSITRWSTTWLVWFFRSPWFLDLRLFLKSITWCLGTTDLRLQSMSSTISVLIWFLNLFLFTNSQYKQLSCLFAEPVWASCSSIKFINWVCYHQNTTSYKGWIQQIPPFWWWQTNWPYWPGLRNQQMILALKR